MPSAWKATPHRRLVVFHQGALGDFLLTLPALEGLYRADERIRIDFWTRPEYFALIAGEPYAGKVHSCESTALMPFYQDDCCRVAEVPDFFHGAQGILIFGQQGSRILASELAGRVHCPVHWIQSFPTPHAEQFPEHVPVHVCEFQKEQLRRLGWFVADTVVRIQAPLSDLGAARKAMKYSEKLGDGRFAILHPGSGGKRKIWPLSLWWELLCWLLEAWDGSVVLTLGPADEVLSDFARNARNLGVHIQKGLSLTRLAAFLAESRFFVGNDSGVSHLAAMVGIPTVAIFGPTDSGTWAPRGPNVQIVQTVWDESRNLVWTPRSSCADHQKERGIQAVRDKLITWRICKEKKGAF